MDKPKITETATKIVDLLEPFDSQERLRIVHGALTLLGDVFVAPNQENHPAGEGVEATIVSNQARIWMKQNQVSDQELQLIFHIADGKVEIVAAEIPGKDGKAKSINAYILQGLASFLNSGVAKFDDKSARALCVKYGCYSAANHAVYMKAIGNKAAGSKETGWTLTSPGLKVAAELVKGLVK
jgi:hypothetical protein